MNKLIEKLRAAAESLAALFKDPHPGLLGWGKAIADNMKVLDDWWNGESNGTVVVREKQ